MDFGTPTSAITELRIILFVQVLPRTEHTWEEDAEMEEELKAGSKGFSCSMPVRLVWTDQPDCLQEAGYSDSSPEKMGFSSASHSNSQFPVGTSILVTRRSAGSGNRSTSFRARRYSPSFALHRAVSRWQTCPQRLGVRRAVKRGGFAPLSPAPPGTVQRALLHRPSFISAGFGEHPRSHAPRWRYP